MGKWGYFEVYLFLIRIGFQYGLQALTHLALNSLTTSATAPSLQTLQDLMAADLERVNAEILTRLQSEVALIPTLARHLIAAGGKRIRPLLTLASARLCGYGGDKHVLLAACVEFIHTATLLHDDVVDESDLRRGNATANTVWGNQAPVLVGDFLFSRAFQLMVQAESLEILDILANASAIIAEGEVMQLAGANDLSRGKDYYRKVIEAKTAALFGAACKIGAVLAQRPQAEADALNRYGINLGVAFQIVDDVLDYDAKAADMGKNAGDDFREGKITLPVLIAYERGDEAERAFWRRCLEESQWNETDFAEAQALMRRHDALALCLAEAEAISRTAAEALAPFSASPIKNAMIEALAFNLTRAA